MVDLTGAQTQAAKETSDEDAAAGLRELDEFQEGTRTLNSLFSELNPGGKFNGKFRAGFPHTLSSAIAGPPWPDYIPENRRNLDFPTYEVLIGGLKLTVPRYFAGYDRAHNHFKIEHVIDSEGSSSYRPPGHTPSFSPLANRAERLNDFVTFILESMALTDDESQRLHRLLQSKQLDNPVIQEMSKLLRERLHGLTPRPQGLTNG